MWDKYYVSNRRYDVSLSLKVSILKKIRTMFLGFMACFIFD